MITMIVSDLDGTLLPKGESQLKSTFLDFVRAQKDGGRVFAVASGRSYAELKRFFAPVLYDMYFICENGAMVFYQGKVRMKRPLGREAFEQITAWLEADGYEWAAAGVHTIYTSGSHQKVSSYYKNVGLSVMKVPSAREIPEETLRLSVCCQGVERQALTEKLKETAGKETKVIYADEQWMDIVTAGVDKGMAVSWLCNRTGIRPEEMAVFGDNVNDIEMLQVTENSYAMEWASAEVKTYARHTTGCVMSTVKDLNLV